MKTFVISLALILTACATTDSRVVLPAQRDPVRVPAGFSGLPDSGVTSSNLYKGPFEFGAEQGRRAAKVYLPIQYDTQASWPLVVLLHGFSGTAEAEDAYLGLRFRASLRGFILLTPNGTITPEGTIGVKGENLGGNPFWNATDACCDFAHTGVDDARYLARIIAETKQSYHVDPKRVYLFGHSNGGFMVNRMACELGSDIAGIANLAGGSYLDPGKCAHPAATPYLHIQAVDDPTIAYANAPDYAAGVETVAQWVNRNGCKGSPRTGADADYVLLIPKKDTTSKEWTNCSSGKPVEFWTIRPYQHKLHNSHVPLFNLNFTDRVLDFLFAR